MTDCKTCESRHERKVEKRLKSLDQMTSLIAGMLTVLGMATGVTLLCILLVAFKAKAIERALRAEPITPIVEPRTANVESADDE
jgi:hypothetical protein